ncbi:putative ribonuclease H-like domain-containing protein [Tanacetum coccineum]
MISRFSRTFEIYKSIIIVPTKQSDNKVLNQEKDDNVNNTNNINAASTNEVNDVGAKTSIELPFDPNMSSLEDISIFGFIRDDEDYDHPLDQVIGDLQSATQTRRMSKNLEEHRRTQKDLPNGKRAIGTKWVFKNKKDERGIVIRNKAILVAQGYTQEEGIDYDEIFAPVARIEATRLFLAYASFKDFVVYQTDVKSDFLYEKIEEEVYLCQPPGFEDPDFPGRVYKVEKALYGLHQAPRAWYETLSTYLLDNEFQRGKIDKTLFIKRHKGNILLVQVYMDDIIFGSTKKELCNAFEKLMHEKFQMSSMGELTFFLGLQVQQKKDGIFISQDKYVGEILKKFGFTEVKTASTPMETQKPLLKDEDGEEVDVHMYRSMIGSLMYLTSSRPDIMFAVCACARYQVNLKVSHLHAVKRIFRYLKGQPKLGLWYPKDSPFDLVAYTDSDYAGASLDRKSTTGGCQFLGSRLISWQCKKQIVGDLVSKRIERSGELKNRKRVEYIKSRQSVWNGIRVNAGGPKLMLLGINLQLLVKVNAARHKLTTAFEKQFWSTVKAKTVNGEVQLHALMDKKRIIITDSIVRRDLQLEVAEGVDCLPNVTIFEQLALMGSKTTAWNEFSSTMASVIICLATNQKFNFSKYIFESMVKNLDNAGIFLMYQRKPKRKDTQIPQSSGPTDNIADEAVNEEMDDSLVRAATTSSSLEAEQDSGNVTKTRTKATPNESSSLGTTSGGGPRCQETMGDTIAQTRFENVSKTSNDPLLVRGNTLRSGENSLKLNELMELCTNLQQRVLDLDTTKTTQANEIANEGLGEEDASKQRRIADIDANKDIYLVNVHTDEDIFGVIDLDGDEVIVDNVDVVKTAEETRSVVEEVTTIIEKAKLGSVAEETVNAVATTVSTASTIPVSAAITTITATIIDVEITLAQALTELKIAKPKAVKVVIQEPEQGTTTTTPTIIIYVPKLPQDKGKGIMIEEPVVEQVKPMKRLEQMRLDKELAFKLPSEEEEEEERLAREKAHQTEEANIAWDDVQSKIEANYQLAQRLQAQEQEELTDEEKERLFVQFLEQRRKYFTANRAEEKRNRPPTRAQQRSIITELVEESSKKAKTELEENSKKSEAEISNESQDVEMSVKLLMLHLYLSNLQPLLTTRSTKKGRKDISKLSEQMMFNDVKLQVDYECEMAFELLRLVKKQLKEGYVPE